MPYKDPEKRREYHKKYTTKWYKKNKSKYKIYKKRHISKLRQKLGEEEFLKQQRENRYSYKRESICEICSALVRAYHKRKYCDDCKHKNKIGNSHYKKVDPKNRPRGENHPQWKGGRTPLRKQIRDHSRYKEWRTSIFQRDQYTCVECDARNGHGKHVRIEADHYPIEFAKILDQEKIISVSQALESILLWDISNGRTLCITCHNKTKNGRRKQN